MLKTASQKNAIGGSVVQLDYLIWALSQTNGNFDTVQCETNGREPVHLGALTYLAHELNATLCLIAVPHTDGSFARCLHVSEQLPGKRPAEQEAILAAWFSSLVANQPLDELAWGAQLSEQTILRILKGQHTRVDHLARFALSSGYQLRFYFDSGRCAIGSAEFCRRHPYATPERFRAQGVAGLQPTAKEVVSLLRKTEKVRS